MEKEENMTTQITTPLFFDDFNSTLNAANWDYNQWKYGGSFYGRTQQRQELPVVSGGEMHLNLDTYNPTNGPIPSFYGSEAITKQIFSNEAGGIVFEINAHFVNPAGGIVGGMFSYIINTGNLHDEIDFEALTNKPYEVNTNVYKNEPTNSTGHYQFIPISSAITDEHTYRIEWFKNAMLWYIDGQLVREQTDNIPEHPMALHLNIWAPASDWEDAFNPALNPVTNPADNTDYFFDINSVRVTQLPSSYYSFDIVKFNPTDGVSDVAVGHNILLTFNQDIHTGSGTIVIHSGSVTGTPIATYDVATSTNLSVSGHTLTINPTADLAYGTHYFVTLDPGSIKDLVGYSYAGTSAYDFTTEQHVVPPSIMAGSIESWEYFASYADLRGWALLDGVLDAADSANAAAHCNRYAAAEGRTIIFDAWEYLASNPDLMNWLTADGLSVADAVTAAKHYIQYGVNEGRLMAFDSAAYLAANSDLQDWIYDSLHLGGDAAYDFAAQHYISFGRHEHRPGGINNASLEVAAAAVDETSTTHIDLNGGEVIETHVALSGIVTPSELPAQFEFA